MAKLTLVDSKGAPILSDAAKEEAAQELGDLESRTKIYSLSPDIASCLLDIIQLSFLSTEFGPEQTVDAVEEITGMILETDPSDPTGTRLTINKDWLTRFRTDAQAFMEYATRVFTMAETAAKKIEEQASTPVPDSEKN